MIYFYVFFTVFIASIAFTLSYVTVQKRVKEEKIKFFNDNLFGKVDEYLSQDIPKWIDDKLKQNEENEELRKTITELEHRLCDAYLRLYKVKPEEVFIKMEEFLSLLKPGSIENNINPNRLKEEVFKK